MEYLPRKIEEKLENLLNREEFLLIKGPRQAGKTTLLLHLKEKLNAVYITLEDPDYRDVVIKNFKQFLADCIKKSKYLLIDEAQYVKDIGSKLKLAYDLFHGKLKIISTGSGSFDVKVQIGKYLVGRAFYLELLPLTFEEFLMWKRKDLYSTFKEYKKTFLEFLKDGTANYAPMFEREFYSALEEYIVYGGFPAVVKEPDKKMKTTILKNLAETYLEKDIGFFFGIRRLEKMRELIKYLSINDSKLLRLSEVSRLLSIDYKTLTSYLSVLSQTYVISLIGNFRVNLTSELKKTRKIEFYDTGFRNAILNDYRPLESRTDVGELLENFIWIQLNAVFDDVKYWRTTSKKEVDFIIKADQELIPIEVKTKETKLGSGMKSFIQKYKPKKAVIFTQSKFGIENFKSTKILYLPHFYV